MGKTTFQKAEFELLRQRLLLRALDKVGIWEAHVEIMREAKVAGEIASQTGFPSLIFPSLFEERVSAVLQRFHQREDAYWGSLRSNVNGGEIRISPMSIPLRADTAPPSVPATAS
jgi:hypothetical protein